MTSHTITHKTIRSVHFIRLAAERALCPDDVLQKADVGVLHTRNCCCDVFGLDVKVMRAE